MKKLSELEYVSMKGEGYFCTIKQYRDPEDQVLYALKELKKEHVSNEDYKTRFQKEILIIRRLQGCGHIIDLIDYNDSIEGDGMYMLMPFADYNLSSFIASTNSNPDIELRYDIFEQIIFAINFAHRKSILHRDLAPSNILLFEDNNQINVKVSDFGLGKDLSSLSNLTTSSASDYGHVYYTAPEQLENLRNASFRSDIYSLGCVCYYVFTGKKPSKILAFDLITLVNKATSYSPSDRHQDIDEFEKHYIRLKKMVLSRADQNQYVSLKKFLKQPGPLDINELHEKLIEPKQYADIIHDFLFPVTEYFLEGNNLPKYYKTVGTNIIYFVENYSTYIHMLPKFGWDFKNLDNCGKLLKDIVKLVDVSQSKFLCFKLILHIAYYYGRYYAQGELKYIFTEEWITGDIEIQLAEFIESCSFNFKEEHFNLDETPATIRSIILEKIRIKKEEEEEYRKRMENMDIDI